MAWESVGIRLQGKLGCMRTFNHIVMSSKSLLMHRLLTLLLLATVVAGHLDNPKFANQWRSARRSRSRTEILFLKDPMVERKTKFSYMLKQPIVSFAPQITEKPRMKGKIRKLSNRFSVIGL
uniref:Uncharacterized protein n=1 Tax=Steinernema glaseri TaxID=37863 RepID=A0A1I7Y9A0_9BILA